MASENPTCNQERDQEEDLKRPLNALYWLNWHVSYRHKKVNLPKGMKSRNCEDENDDGGEEDFFFSPRRRPTSGSGLYEQFYERPFG